MAMITLSQVKKSYVPYANDAESMIVYAKLNGETQGFILPRKTDGLEVGERQKLLGLHALPLYPLQLNGVRVSRENQVGWRRWT